MMWHNGKDELGLLGQVKTTAMSLKQDLYIGISGGAWIMEKAG